MQPLGSESATSRYRSPAFSKTEVKTLLELIDKYKTIILNKATNAAANRAKDLAWAKITKIFNSKGFEHKRQNNCLRNKWDNLKREAKKANKNILEYNDSDFDEMTGQIVAMINEAEHFTNDVLIPKELEDDDDLELDKPKDDTENPDEDEEICSKIFSGDDDPGKRKRNRSISRSVNFTPQECNLLLKCVRAEKKYVFCKVNNKANSPLKNRAWARITKAYNSQSPIKRTMTVLHTKFGNMKRMSRKMGILRKPNSLSALKKNLQGYSKLEKHDLDILENMKSEPFFEAENDSELDDDISSNCGQNEDSIDALNGTSDTNHYNVSPDPLSVIINSDSGIGLNSNAESFSNSDNNEATKLKLELLKQQLDNAKLEKKRIEDAIRAEAAAVEKRETEMALRLRAARLEAVAAEMKLPIGHPALQYTHEERRAQNYINSGHT